MQIVYAFLRTGGRLPVLLDRGSVLPQNPLLDDRLDAVRQAQAAAAAAIDRSGGSLRSPFPILHALGNGLKGATLSDMVRGQPDIGMVFLEDTAIPPAAKERAGRYRTIVAGSSWNGEVLEAAGFANVIVCPQGINPSISHPAPRAGYLHDRFVVFSGGKLEHRKGQDLVVEAFRHFHSRHPESVLVAAWHNHWPQTAMGIARSRWVKAEPTVDEAGRLRVADWLLANGLPAGSFRVVPGVPHILMATIMREADVAVFPNRCEGGTNLVAMEALACGVPTILSANTGHLDLTRDVPCHALTDQASVSPEEAGMGTEGWGESSVDEILEHLEAVYTDREAARIRGAAAAERMLEAWTWERRIGELFAGLDIGLSG